MQHSSIGRYNAGVSPTIHRADGYRFFFFSNESHEPKHVHVQRDRMLAKFWLEPVALARSTGYSPQELRRLAELVNENANAFRKAWDDHFGN